MGGLSIPRWGCRGSPKFILTNISFPVSSLLTSDSNCSMLRSPPPSFTRWGWFHHSYVGTYNCEDTSLTIVMNPIINWMSYMYIIASYYYSVCVCFTHMLILVYIAGNVLIFSSLIYYCLATFLWRFGEFFSVSNSKKHYIACALTALNIQITKFNEGCFYGCQSHPL